MQIPDEAVDEAVAAIMSAANMNDDEPERFEARVLARAALEAAAPILAKTWGVTGRRQPRPGSENMAESAAELHRSGDVRRWAPEADL